MDKNTEKLDHLGQNIGEEFKKLSTDSVEKGNVIKNASAGSTEVIDGEPLPIDSELLSDFPSDTTELYLSHSKISSITALRLGVEEKVVDKETGKEIVIIVPRFKKLRYLCLRQNFIRSLTGLEVLDPKYLEEIDLYDNQIKHIKRIGKFTNLVSLDFSFNRIKHIPSNIIKNLNMEKKNGIEAQNKSKENDEEEDDDDEDEYDEEDEIYKDNLGLIPLYKLKDLYLIQNKITKIENLYDESLRKQNIPQLADVLFNLELGGNKIRKIENLDGFKVLEQLWLGKNKIPRFENLGSNLSTLKILALQSNRITKLEGLDHLVNLTELYLSHNGISKLENLDKLTKLEVIDFSNNRIEKLENLKHLKKLREVWASNNLISDFQQVEKELKHLEQLDTVYFEGNPLQTENRYNYNYKLRLCLGPSIRQIDANYIR